MEDDRLHKQRVNRQWFANTEVEQLPTARVASGNYEYHVAAVGKFQYERVDCVLLLAISITRHS
jgi:hypothetical protein